MIGSHNTWCHMGSQEESRLNSLHKKGRWRVDSCVYIDDIIFRSTKDELAHNSLILMQVEFEISMIG